MYFFKIRYFDDIETNRIQSEMGIVYGDSINEAMDNITLVYTEETIKEVNLSYIENTCCGVLTFTENMVSLLNYLMGEK